METILTLIFDLLLLGVYSITAFGIFMIIQLISYRVFNFNLYKKLDKILFR